jgi:2-desacetyl-2-hydroxyethyl bacteriochlorophyllide A dehydrogenase
MKAIVFEEKQKLKYTEIEKPKIANDEVLIKVKYCGICGTDVALYFGDMPYINAGMQKYPFIPGHEWSGEIVEIGNEIKNFKIGDKVAGDVAIGCGKCKICLEGRYNLCPNRYEVGCYRNKQGAMAEYIVMPGKNVYRLSKNIEYIAGAIVEPLATAIHGLSMKRIPYDEHILVTGTGIIGILAAQLAQLNRSSNVVLIGRTSEKLNIARECGINNTINIKDIELKNDNSILHDFDFCIECSGNITALKQCIRSVKPGGHISIIGFYENFTEVVNFDDITIKNLEIHGILGSPNCFNQAINLLDKGLINYKPLISKIFPLNETEEAIKYLLDKKNKAIKVMLKID